MFRCQKRRWLFAVLVGAAPLVTVATCNESPYGPRVLVQSTNDDLVDDVFEFLFDDDDD